VPQYVSDMVTLIARLDVTQVDWVGTSMGGLIGMLLAAQPGAPIGKLIMNDVGPFVPKADKLAGAAGCPEMGVREVFAPVGLGFWRVLPSVAD
jgi:pimeloyl-ACP methyl ester carboxylesterase